MFLVKFAFWLVTLPLRLALWVLGLVLWVVTLPLRLLFGALGLIGFGRLLQLAVLGGAAYFFYRLINTPSQEDDAPTARESERIPST